MIKKTDLILAGRTKAQVIETIAAAIDKELPATKPGAMCYIPSKQGYLSDRDGHWHPHLMFSFHNPILRHGEPICPALPLVINRMRR